MFSKIKNTFSQPFGRTTCVCASIHVHQPNHIITVKFRFLLAPFVCFHSITLHSRSSGAVFRARMNECVSFLFKDVRIFFVQFKSTRSEATKSLRIRCYDVIECLLCLASISLAYERGKKLMWLSTKERRTKKTLKFAVHSNERYENIAD